MVMTLAFGISSLGLVNGQVSKTLKENNSKNKIKQSSLCGHFPFKPGCKNPLIQIVQECLGMESKYLTGIFCSETLRNLISQRGEDIITEEVFNSLMRYCKKPTYSELITNENGQGAYTYRDGSKNVGQVNGQPHKSTSLGLVCNLRKTCEVNNCLLGFIQGSITCKRCIGVSNDALWHNPCPDCGRSRKVWGNIRKCDKCDFGNIPGGRLQVADADFPEEMSWYDAQSACTSLGPGWRLPTIPELKAMHKQLHSQGKGNFHTSSSVKKYGYHWSIDKGYREGMDGTFKSCHSFRFDASYSNILIDNDTDLYGNPTIEKGWVRAVRTLR